MGKVVRAHFSNGSWREVECESVREEMPFLKLYRKDGTNYGIPYAQLLYWSVRDGDAGDTDASAGETGTGEPDVTDVASGNRCTCKPISAPSINDPSHHYPGEFDPRCIIHATVHRHQDRLGYHFAIDCPGPGDCPYYIVEDR